MKRLRETFKCRSCYAGILVQLMVLFRTFEGLTQPSSAPAESLTVSVEPLCKGKRLEDQAIVPAPANIFIFVHLETTANMRAGDAVNIDFFADGEKLCSDRAVWHDAIRPSNRPGIASPMIVAPAQFGLPSCEWTNAPAGKHTLTARAYGFHNLSATSEPVHITVLTPPAVP